MKSTNRSCIVVLAALAITAPASAQQAPKTTTMAADDVLQRSIAYHDPAGMWNDGSFRIRLSETGPNRGPRQTTILIENEAGRFYMRREIDGHTIESTVTGDECWTRLDGSSDLTATQIDEFRLSCERMQFTRNYYTYLYGLPMKLRDAGTIIGPDATLTRFQERAAWAIRVTYDPEVGGDTWYFYFDPDSWALIGYRFYHDESANDGEYIVLRDEAEGGDLRLPAVRTWYTHAEDKLLGTDTIESIERISRER